MVGEKGADFIGFIMSEGYKRSVDKQAAKEIVAAALEGGAQPIGVFTKENAEEMTNACTEIGLNTVQLHGDTPRYDCARPDSFLSFGLSICSHLLIQ